MDHRLFLIVAIALASLAQACGPVTAHSSIARAHIAIKASEGARAQELAIFEYESARLYWIKAKREEGLSSFQSAIDLAQLSRDFADKARARALKNAQAMPLTPTERRRQMINVGERPSSSVMPTPAMPNPMMQAPVTTPNAPHFGGR